jgi:peptidyl-prolyl cis-trans isomerase D
VDEAAIQDYYDKNATEFQLPERARVAYVTFSAEALAAQITVSDTDVKAYFDEHQTEFSTPEQRQVAHILFNAPTTAGDAEKQAARAKAETVLKLAQQSPDKFAELAKQYSDDAGSAAQGGTLDVFVRGVTTPLNQSLIQDAFALKPGEISGIVQSDFGYHLLKVLAITPAKVTPLEQVRASIEQQLKQQKTREQFAALADQFGDQLLMRSDSLQPAADLVKMPIRESAWLNKGQSNTAPWTDQVLQAVFSSDVINSKRNSAAIETGADSLIAVRLLEYQPAGKRELAEVSESIRQTLLLQQAQTLAIKQGQAYLAQLQQGGNPPPSLQWTPPQTIRYEQVGRSELGRQVFQVNTEKLPAYVGLEDPREGFAIARVEAVKEGEVDDAARAGYAKLRRDQVGAEAMEAFLANLRQQAKIEFKGFAKDSGNEEQ